MKKLVLTLSLVTGLAAGLYAQGDLGSQGVTSSPAYPSNLGSFTFDNDANTSVSDTATANGLVWIGADIPSATLLNDDINMSISDANGTIVSLLLSDSTASGDITFFGSGLAYDNSGYVYYILGSTGGGSVNVTLSAWTGSGNTYAGDLIDPSQYAGSVAFSLVLGNYTTGGPSSTATDFTAMPALVLLPGVAPVPEPATLALVGLGSLSLMLFRRKNS